MNKKIMLIVGLFGLILVGAGCEFDTTSTAPTPSTYQSDTAKVEETQKRVQTSVPIPTIANSVERKNISKRATTFDKQNKVSYIYLISYGKVMANYVVDGKVSSLNSYLSPIEKLVDADGKPCVEHAAFSSNGGYTYKPCYSVQAPDIDGAYGDNADGIFFFTTDGAYVEWSGEYMMSDSPLKLTTQPELVRSIQ